MKDQEILTLIQSENTRNKGFSMLIDIYQKQVYFQVRKIVFDHQFAEDITQNVFVKIYKNIHSFKGTAKLSSWIFRIAYNESITFVNKQKKIIQPQSQELTREIVSETQTEESEKIIQKLHQAIKTLPKKQKMVFNYRYFSEMKYSEIAEIMQVSVGSLKASYHIAVKKVEEFILNN